MGATCDYMVPAALHKRLARLVRKDRMFEWAEWKANNSNCPDIYGYVVKAAREWWRKRSKR